MIKRLIGWFILVPISILLVIFALANRQQITLNFDPISAENPLIASVNLPLFIVIFFMLVLGILLGAIAVFFSQAKIKNQRNKLKKQVKNLELELFEIKKTSRQNIDDKSLLAPDDFI